MPVFLDNSYNPNPISKLLVTFLLGFTVFHKVNIYFEWGIILLISFLFYKNGIKKTALKNILFFAVFSLLIPNLDVIRNMNTILKRCQYLCSRHRGVLQHRWTVVEIDADRGYCQICRIRQTYP